MKRFIRNVSKPRSIPAGVKEQQSDKHKRVYPVKDRQSSTAHSSDACAQCVWRSRINLHGMSSFPCLDCCVRNVYASLNYYLTEDLRERVVNKVADLPFNNRFEQCAECMFASGSSTQQPCKSCKSPRFKPGRFRPSHMCNLQLYPEHI